jgi:mannan polymerase II complex ANP1 subunit
MSSYLVCSLDLSKSEASAANMFADVWRPLPDWLGGEQPYDLNSWQESETALALADTLDEDAVIVEGYAEYATWRPHLAYLRDPYGDPDMEMEIDGVGGVSILAKAKVFRSGVHFPAFSFEKHAETEGFGKVRSYAALDDSSRCLETYKEHRWQNA